MFPIQTPDVNAWSQQASKDFARISPAQREAQDLSNQKEALSIGTLQNADIGMNKFRDWLSNNPTADTGLQIDAALKFGAGDPQGLLSAKAAFTAKQQADQERVTSFKNAVLEKQSADLGHLFEVNKNDEVALQSTFAQAHDLVKQGIIMPEALSRLVGINGIGEPALLSQARANKEALYAKRNDDLFQAKQKESLTLQKDIDFTDVYGQKVHIPNQYQAEMNKKEKERQIIVNNPAQSPDKSIAPSAINAAMKPLTSFQTNPTIVRTSQQLSTVSNLVSNIHRVTRFYELQDKETQGQLTPQEVQEKLRLSSTLGIMRGTVAMDIVKSITGGSRSSNRQFEEVLELQGLQGKWNHLVSEFTSRPSYQTAKTWEAEAFDTIYKPIRDSWSTALEESKSAAETNVSNLSLAYPDKDLTPLSASVDTLYKKYLNGSAISNMDRQLSDYHGGTNPVAPTAMATSHDMRKPRPATP